MKNSFFCAILVGAISTIHASDKEIIAVTKNPSSNSFLFNDTQQLALAYTLMHEQKFYPIQVGSRSISAEKFSALTPDQRSLVNGISHPGCCSRLCGYDYSIATAADIRKLEEEMPKGFMNDHRILKIKLPRPLCKDFYVDDQDICHQACCCSTFGSIPFATGAFTFFLGGIISNCATPVLIAGGVQCAVAALFNVGVWGIAGIRSFCYYNTEEYVFGVSNANNDEEEINLSQSSD